MNKSLVAVVSLSLFLILLITGCATTSGVMEAEGGTYIISV
jgi:hypothetical protein